MDTNLLKTTVQAMVAPGKGLLAADESSKTIQKRFDKIGLTSTPETNLAYRQMLFTTEGIEQYISGVILFDETFRQEITGLPMPKYLESKGILPGIKVDKGAVDFPARNASQPASQAERGSQGASVAGGEGHPNEKITEGLEGLNERMVEYNKMGAKFAKWRAVITIGQGIPSDDCILENAKRLAEYAFICQQNNIVPIVEPEVLMDGDNTVEVCKEVTTRVLKAVFASLKEKGVYLEGIILKPNMVISGKLCPTQATSEEVAKATVETLLETVPAEVPGIMFLSGGQTPDQATENLAKINAISGSPWKLSFSYGRALQDEALTAWFGKDENVESAQKVFLERTQKASEARSVNI